MRTGVGPPFRGDSSPGVRDLNLERLGHRDRNLALLTRRVRELDLHQPGATFAAQKMQLGALRQPVVIESSSPANRARNRRTPSRCAGAPHARPISPVAVAIHSVVICARCWSNPISIVIRGRLKLHCLNTCAHYPRSS